MSERITDEDDWVGHPRCDSPTEAEQSLIDRRADLEVVGRVYDADACCSYDDWALVRLDGRYYLLRTSGCSCPYPKATWSVEMGPAGLDEVETYLRDRAGENGFGVTVRQHEEFLALVETARAEEKAADAAVAEGEAAAAQTTGGSGS